MSKMSYHARSDHALTDVTVAINGLDVEMDVFIKILDASVLSREGYVAAYVAWCSPGIRDDVADIVLDPKFNAASNTFFARYTTTLESTFPGAFRFQVNWGYYTAENAESAIEVSGTIPAV